MARATALRKCGCSWANHSLFNTGDNRSAAIGVDAYDRVVRMRSYVKCAVPVDSEIVSPYLFGMNHSRTCETFLNGHPDDQCTVRVGSV